MVEAKSKTFLITFKNENKTIPQQELKQIIINQ